MGYMATLHSIMFLLILLLPRPSFSILSSLHSIMFLLIRKRYRMYSSRPASFTFHNVSINTYRPGINLFRFFLFTFHNVSINTPIPGSEKTLSPTLHSIMFLLIRCQANSFQCQYCLYIP